MPSKTPSREEFKIEGDQVTHVPTGKRYEANPGSADIVNENGADVGEYGQSDIRAMARALLAERVRITERLR
jgi:hypothetical protein